MPLWYNDPQPVQRVNRLPASVYTTGDQPPFISAAGAIAMACVLASTPTWAAQSASNNAAINIPPVTASPYLPGVQTPWWINAQWSAPAGDVFYAGGFTPDTAGDLPPVTGPLTPSEISLLGLTAEAARPEPTRPTAGWNVPVLASSFLPSPSQQWQVLAPAIWWPAQSEPETAAWNTPVTSDNPPPSRHRFHYLRQMWEPPFQMPEGLEGVVAIIFVPPALPLALTLWASLAQVMPLVVGRDIGVTPPATQIQPSVPITRFGP